MEVKQAAVHYLSKTRDPDGPAIPSVLTLRPTLLPVTEKLTNLVSTLRQLYNNKAGHGYGIFHENQDIYPFSRFLVDHGKHDWDFLGFTHRAMHLLKAKIDDVLFATGGYMMFVSYVDEQNNSFLIVASLKNRPGFVFNENLDLTDQEHVDLDHLHEMARINMTSWRVGGSRYLSFAKRRSSGDDFTKYFREFIGCDEFTESRELTKSLLVAVQAYTANAEPEVRQRARQAVFDYCDEKRNAKETVSLRALSARLSDDVPEAFLQFLNENVEYGVGDDFEPDRNVYRALRRFKGGDKRLNIAFDADQLGGRVVYNPEAGTLLINDLPANLRAQLESQ